MSHVESLSESLVHDVPKSEITEHDDYKRAPTEDIPCIAANGLPADVIAGNILSPHSYCRNIDPILRLAHEFQEEDRHISLILCKHAYTLAQNLYPSTEARIMLHCIKEKMSVIQKNVANNEGADFDQSQETTRLLKVYTRYRENNYNVDNVSEDSIRIKENLKVLGTVLEQQYPQEANRLISAELRQKIESDTAMTTDETAYNIVPIDVPATTNAITSFPEVRAAISSLKFLTDLPNLPDGTIAADVLDFLQYVFGFQKDSVSNQRENIVILLSDEQSRLSPLVGENPMLNDTAVKKVFDKTFDNYTNWCTYVKKDELWKEEEITTKDQILYISLYYLIWGEAANVRFLPECLCYIFHHMKIELDCVVSKGQKKNAERAKSCVSGDGASYLKQVICPVYDVIALEANNSDDGKAPYSTWRNYDDFNEYFWSPKCFELLSWPLDTKSPFFQKPSARTTSSPSAGLTSNPSAGSTSNSSAGSNSDPSTGLTSHPSAGPTSDASAGSKVPGKTFIEHRTFLHLYHSFHRLWIFLVMMFQGLVIIAWNDGKILDFKTLRGVLSLGPTYFLMKLVQCVLDLRFMHGAHSTTRIIKRFIWFMWATLSIYFLYVKGLDVNISPYLQLIIFVTYIIVLVIYVAIESYQSKLAFVLNLCDNSFLGRFLREIPQEDCYVGRDLVETRFNKIMYTLFWLSILVINFAYAYFYLIIPLVTSSRDIVSENTHTVLVIGSSWVGMFSEYLLAVHIIYIFISTLVAFLRGAWDGLGKIRSMHDVDKNFQSFPEAFMHNLHITYKRGPSIKNAQDLEKENVARFSPFWNKIVDYLWEEDYITTDEQEKLRIPESSQGTKDTTIKWPSFLDNKSKKQIPRNQEARRRLVYFTNTLFMTMPKPVAVREMLAFSVFTPYFKETVLYSMVELCKDIGQGITFLAYLQNTYPDEWENFLARMDLPKSTSVSYFLENDDDKRILELRFWASYRGQTLARTVRGMMYNREALVFQSYMESVAVEEDLETKTEKSYQFQYEARAYADLKFTYVITCQLYSTQKKEQDPKAADIALLLKRNEALRVAFIDEEDMGNKKTMYSSKLVKGDINGKEKEVYTIELPGPFKLGEGKPENQNHAIVFTRGNAVQTIDMNQDNYFEETLKMRNLLREFRSDHRIHHASILGVREHIYTERASTVASFMSKQENSFVTITQRFLANLLKVRMHYGHPDVFDRVFHITRGGISKASCGINVSEDIYAGFNSTLRKGNITHHEYIQVGKGRDVGLHEISIFERKVAGGNGAQVLSRDVYRLGQRFDFFRMLSFYYTSVGYYFYNWLTVIMLYILLYGHQLIAETHVVRVLGHSDIILFLLFAYPALHIILCSFLEQDFEMAGSDYMQMQANGAPAFFTFFLGTRMHWFGRTILHGGSGYQATGRGFNLAHTKFLENYRLYSRSHFVKAMEMLLLGLFGNFKRTRTQGSDNSFVCIILAVLWIGAPFWFDPSDITDDDHMKDFEEWKDWLNSSGDESWKAWWEKEISHIQTLEGIAVETFLSLRFFIIQYGVYQKMDALGAKTSFMNYLILWVLAVALSVFFEMRKIRQLSSVNVQMLSELIQKSYFIRACFEGVQGPSKISSIHETAFFFMAITFLFIVPPIVPHIIERLVFISAFIPTFWGILSICVILKPVMIKIRLWETVISLARINEFAIGTMVFGIISIKRFFRWAINNAGKNTPDEEITSPTTAPTRGDANVSHANVTKKQSKLTKVPSLNAQGNRNSRDGTRDEPAYSFNVEVDQRNIFMQKSSNDLYINGKDVSDLLYNQKLDVAILTVFEMSLYRLEQSSNSCGFLNPLLIAAHRGHDAKSDATSYLKDVVEIQDYLNYKFLLAPYFLNEHWVLFIICPNEKKGFILDSCKQNKTKDSYPLTSVVEEVVDNNIEWVRVECNQQLESWECGYYVLKWMHDFVTIPEYRDNFLNKTPWTNEPLSPGELKDIVDKWFEFCSDLPGLEELTSTTDKKVAQAKQSKVKLAMLDDGVNANVDDQANPSNFATKEKEEEVQGAAPKSDGEESFYPAKLVTQDESSSNDSRRKKAPRVIADSEKAKKMEELISTIAKAMVLAKELEVMAQVPKEKEELHASLVRLTTSVYYL